MNLYISESKSTNRINKVCFKSKTPTRNGLILHVESAARFQNATFNRCNSTLACSNNEGCIFFINLHENKYWNIPMRLNNSLIKFSTINDSDLLVCLTNGQITIVEIHSGTIRGKLLGHKYSIKSLTFSCNSEIALSSSKFEAIIWDLKTNVKMQVLNLENENSLKFVTFMPISNNILALFQNDTVEIWKCGTFESIKQFQSDKTSKTSIQTIAFTKNSTIMVFVFYQPILSLYDVTNWKQVKLIKLSDYLSTIKHAEFVPVPFDGGNSNILAILCGQRRIHFYNIQNNEIISELHCNMEIRRMYCSPNGNYIACLQCGCDIEVYNLKQFTEPPKVIKVQPIRQGKSRRKSVDRSRLNLIKSQISDLLDTDKLRLILKTYGEYPEVHRQKIWSHLLQLPNNIEQYNKVINRVVLDSFTNLYSTYPLESPNTIKNLRKLLNNLVSWCPFFGQVDYLPVLTFPFARVLENTPVMCFETVCCVIMNWCQYWFEYFPLPPINIFAIIENMLLEHDPELLQHFTENNVQANMYAWPVLESSFSEVLTKFEWLVLWDHIFTNEPAFLLCAIVAFNIFHRIALLAITEHEHFHLFFHHPNPNNIQSLLQKTYYILNNTSENLHPRQYLKSFQKIQVGKYPQFVDYPKVVLECKEIKNLDQEMKELKLSETCLLKNRDKEWQRLKRIEVDNEESTRLIEMEKACLQKILSRKDDIRRQREKLENLRKILINEETEILNITKQKLQERQQTEYKSKLGLLMENLNLSNSTERVANRLKNDLVQRYSELLKHKIKLKQFINDSSSRYKYFDILQEHENQLNSELSKLKNSLNPEKDLTKLNVATGVTVIQELIKRVENELLSENYSGSLKCSDIQADMRLMKLQAEAKSIENEIGKLTELINKSRFIVFSEEENNS